MKLIYSLFLSLCSLVIYAQVDKIHIGNDADEESAILQIDDTNRGVLIPRMTSLQRMSIPNPEIGLLVYDINTNSFWHKSFGVSWTELTDFDTTVIDKISDKDQNTSITLVGNEIEFSVNSIVEAKLNFLYFKLEAENDFLLGSSMLGAGSKFYIDESKMALRAGKVTALQWDPAYVGEVSFAAGLDNIALGYSSAAWGESNFALLDNSIAFGKGNIANKPQSVVWGQANISSGNNAVSWGENNESTNESSTAWGTMNTANGEYSTVWGTGNTAGKTASTSFGKNTETLGEYATSWGEETSAKGDYSTAFGYFTNAESYAETAFGTYPTLYTANDTELPDPEDRVLIVGNGTSLTNRSNAMQVLKNGETNIWGDYQSVVANAESTRLELMDYSGATKEGFEFVYDGDADEFLLRRYNLNAGNFTYTTWKKDGKVGVGVSPQDNRLEVGGNAAKTIAGNWIANSDQRLKKNIVPISDAFALEKVLAMRGVTYQWDDGVTSFKRPEETQLGFVAQELAVLFPSKVFEDSMGYLLTSYGAYDAVFVQAFKEQEMNIESIQSKSTSLKNLISSIESLDGEATLMSRELKDNINRLESYLTENN